MLDGVGCIYCDKYESKRCPIISASPWSKYKNFCSEYRPNRNDNQALSLGVALMRKVRKCLKN
jgi:hypothetical protein